VIGIFKQKTPVNILILFVVSILIRIPYFSTISEPPPTETAGILYHEIYLFIHRFGASKSFLFPAIAYLLIYTQSLQLNRLINHYRMMQRINYLPAISYLVITTLIPEWSYFSPALIANSLLLVMFSGIFRLYHMAKATGAAFNLGLALGISSLVYFPSILFLPWLIFGLLVMRTVRFNEWIICILGVTSPYYFYAAYLAFTDAWSWTKLFQPLTISLPAPEQTLWLAGSGLLLLTPFLIGGYYIQEKLRKMLIQVRKNWSLVLLYLLFTLFVPFVNNSEPRFENWILIAIPLAAFHACTYLYMRQRWISFIIFMVSILFILASQYQGTG